MKLKYNFMINQLGEEYIAVPVADTVIEFNGVLKLNEDGAFIVEALNSDVTYEELCNKVEEKFAITNDEAKENIDYMLEGLKKANLIIE